MRFKQVGNKADTMFIVVRSNETTKWIRKGMIVCSQGSSQGKDVILPSSSVNAITAAALQVGVATNDIAPGQDGEAQVFGMCNFIAYPGSTRASAGVVFPAFVGGAPLNIPGVPDFATNGVLGQAFPAAAAFVGGIWLVGVVPSWPIIPVNPNYTELQSYVPVGGYIKMM